jgi:hypothetical protein
MNRSYAAFSVRRMTAICSNMSSRSSALTFGSAFVVVTGGRHSVC